MAHGEISHIEFPADDTERAKRFYGDLFGWQFQSFEGSPTEYHMVRFSEDTGGAIYESPEGPSTIVYYDVDDIETGRKRVQELGGDADEARPVPGMGRFAHCTDTEGNRFGLWQTDPSAEMPQG
jgi:predicted enzyme related to lactoylglutathione lyase